MENFPHLKCLYFEGNAVESLDGLQTNTELVSLYLHLAGLNLDTLYLARNRIGAGGVADLLGLLECPSITCLDI